MNKTIKDVFSDMYYLNCVFQNLKLEIPKHYSEVQEVTESRKAVHEYLGMNRSSKNPVEKLLQSHVFLISSQIKNNLLVFKTRSIICEEYTLQKFILEYNENIKQYTVKELSYTAKNKAELLITRNKENSDCLSGFILFYSSESARRIKDFIFNYTINNDSYIIKDETKEKSTQHSIFKYELTNSKDIEHFICTLLYIKKSTPIEKEFEKLKYDMYLEDLTLSNKLETIQDTMIKRSNNQMNAFMRVLRRNTNKEL